MFKIFLLQQIKLIKAYESMSYDWEFTYTKNLEKSDFIYFIAQVQF